MKNLKAFQKSQLIYEFGILIQPFEQLARLSGTPTLNDYRIAIAKVQSGDGAWRQKVKEFTTFALDIFFSQEHQDISHVPERCWGELKRVINDQTLQNEPGKVKEAFDKVVENARKRFFEYIERVPIEWEPVVFEANTPYTSYLRIKESFVSVERRLHYFDRYLKPEFFVLFLATIARDIQIKLVTTQGNSTYGVASVLPVSRLASQEFSDYQLIQVTPNDLHDRNLRVDNNIFSLGPGVDRAGMALTNFGPADNSAEAHKVFDNIIADGRIVS